MVKVEHNLSHGEYVSDIINWLTDYIIEEEIYEGFDPNLLQKYFDHNEEYKAFIQSQTRPSKVHKHLVRLPLQETASKEDIYLCIDPLPTSLLIDKKAQYDAIRKQLGRKTGLNIANVLRNIETLYPLEKRILRSYAFDLGFTKSNLPIWLKG